MAIFSPEAFMVITVRVVTTRGLFGWGVCGGVFMVCFPELVGKGGRAGRWADGEGGPAGGHDSDVAGLPGR